MMIVRRYLGKSSLIDIIWLVYMFMQSFFFAMEVFSSSFQSISVLNIFFEGYFYSRVETSSRNLLDSFFFKAEKAFAFKASII